MLHLPDAATLTYPSLPITTAPFTVTITEAGGDELVGSLIADYDDTHHVDIGASGLDSNGDPSTAMIELSYVVFLPEFFWAADTAPSVFADIPMSAARRFSTTVTAPNKSTTQTLYYATPRDVNNIILRGRVNGFPINCPRVAGPVSATDASSHIHMYSIYMVPVASGTVITDLELDQI